MPLRSAWPNEARDFTPWLADNLDVLGQAVGLALELRQKEYPVGRYSLDLLLQDAEGRVVAVENQLEQTDHSHLGQLLTYCAGTQAKVVIWIARTITEEHAAALEWLNANTVTGVGFFGIQVELLRIGDSVPAPNLVVIVRPNDWTKNNRSNRVDPTAWSWDAYVKELRLPRERVEVGRQLVAALIDGIEERDLAWQPVMNKGFVAIQRQGAYNVFIVDLWDNRVPRIAVKLPAAPDELNLISPYPNLKDFWSASEREWGWTVPPGAPIPDLGPLFDLAQNYNPPNGPMTLTSAPTPPA